MSVEVGKVAEQNSALLSVVAGTWTTRFTAYVHSDGGVPTGIRMCTCFGGLKLRGLFQRLSDGCVAGSYMLIQDPAGDDASATDCILRLELDSSGNALVACLRGLLQAFYSGSE